MAPTSTPPFYLVQSTWKQQTFIYETDLAQADLETVVKHITEGQYDTGEITAVYYCSPGSGVMEDATDHVLKRVAEHCRWTNTFPNSVLSNLLDWAGFTIDLHAAE